MGGALLPHTERFHWLIWPTPNTRLMGPADASSLPFKIYVPTLLAINQGTCSVGPELQQEAKSSLKTTAGQLQLSSLRQGCRPDRCRYLDCSILSLRSANESAGNWLPKTKNNMQLTSLCLFICLYSVVLTVSPRKICWHGTNRVLIINNKPDGLCLAVSSLSLLHRHGGMVEAH